MKIPYGNADFADIRRRGSFYVDKTPFLPELESDEFGYKNLIFLRPRRFGKSLLVGMLENYYDISLGVHFDELFRGLWVHDNPTPEKSKYVVLRLDFSKVSVDGGEASLKASFVNSIKTSLMTMVMRYRQRLPEIEELFDRVKSETEPSSVLNIFLGFFAGTPDKLYVLIDEYDTFATALLAMEAKDVYSKVTDKAGFVRSFYRTLKEGSQSGAIARVFITGVTPILLDDLVTGFNVVTNISTHPQFNALAGFTRADVERAVDELLTSRPDLVKIEGVGDRVKLIDVLESHYDGYRFTEDAPDRIFNSNLVVYFLRELSVRARYPRTMLDPNGRTDYQKLHSLWAAAGPQAEERREALEQILAEGHVWSDLVEQFGTRRTSTKSEFISLMYYTGMLTLSTEPPDLNDYLFEVPNRVIRELGFEHYTNLIQDLDGINLMDRPVGAALRKMAQLGDIAPFLEVFRKNVLDVVSIKDLRQYNEKSMKMLLMGAIVTSEVFHVLSEREFAHGFNDLFLSPSTQLAHAKYAWMLELKYLSTGANETQIAKIVEQAEAQLRKYMSDANLVPMLTRGLELKTGTLVFIGCQAVHWREMHQA